MRTQLLIAILLISSTFAATESSKFKAQISSLLNIQSKAVDAVDSALGILRDLKQANVDAQSRSDEINRTQEAELGRQINDLTFIADQNKAIGDESTAHRKHIESEIQVTQENLVWITNRLAEIERKRIQYREHRCYSNMMFIKSLKEHDEALEVVRWLKTDVLGIVDGTAQSELAEINNMDSAQKLQAYAHLFNQKALNEFVQLSQGRQDVNAESADWDTAADDNDRSNLSLNRMGAGTEDRDVGHKLIEAIARLEQHLIDSMRDLERSEIQAAWDLSNWLQGTQAEIAHILEERGVKTTYIDRLLVAIVGAKAREDEAWEIYFESAATLNDALADRELKRAWYAQEKARRNEENSVLDEVIRIFIERVSGLDSGMKNKVNDFSVDGVFNDSDISRSADSQYSHDSGRLQQNLESETRH